MCQTYPNLTWATMPGQKCIAAGIGFMIASSLPVIHVYF